MSEGKYTKCPHLKTSGTPLVAQRNRWHGARESKPASRLLETKCSCGLTGTKRRLDCPKIGTTKEGSALRPTAICWHIEKLDKMIALVKPKKPTIDSENSENDDSETEE